MPSHVEIMTRLLKSLDTCIEACLHGLTHTHTHCHFVRGDIADTGGSLRYFITRRLSMSSQRGDTFTLRAFYDGEPVRQLLQDSPLPEHLLCTSVPIMHVERNTGRSWDIHMCRITYKTMSENILESLFFLTSTVFLQIVLIIRNKQSILDDSLDFSRV